MPRIACPAYPHGPVLRIRTDLSCVFAWIVALCCKTCRPLSFRHGESSHILTPGILFRTRLSIIPAVSPIPMPIQISMLTTGNHQDMYIFPYKILSIPCFPTACISSQPGYRTISARRASTRPIVWGLLRICLSASRRVDLEQSATALRRNF